MGKRGTKKPKDHVAVRLEPEEIARLKALIPRLSEPWRTATISDVMRAALLKGVVVLEHELPLPKHEQHEEAPTSSARRRQSG